jgi:Fe-S-cluster containining protein
VTEIAFYYPTDLRFTCSRCGECCRGSNVLLAEGEADRLASLPWDGADRDLAEIKPGSTLPGDSVPGRLALARREDGACVYLGPSNQCRIHERFGAEAKPLMCRLFPFGFSTLGDRVAVDVSFACKAVREEWGAPLSTQVAEWTRLFPEAPRESKGHRFSRKYDVRGEVLAEVESHLLELLSEERLSLPDRIRAVWEFHRLGTTSDPSTDAARKLREVMRQGIPKQILERPVPHGSETMDKTGRAVFFHLLFLMLNPTPRELFSLSGRAKEREVRLRVQAADAYKFSDARPLIDNRESRATFRAIGAVSPEYLARGDGSSLLARYLGAKIQGQRFMREGDEEIPFLEAVPRLLLSYPMAVWTAKALAAERGAAEAKDVDARGALRLIDRAFGQIRLSLLPSAQRKAFRFVLLETDLPIAATWEMLAAHNPR